jgi:hypothetical protein
VILLFLFVVSDYYLLILHNTKSKILAKVTNKNTKIKRKIKKKRLNKRNLTEMEKEFIHNFNYDTYIQNELSQKGTK